MLKQKYTIAIIGGTGAEGSGLALRGAHAGHRVIGSRDAWINRTYKISDAGIAVTGLD